MLKLRFAVFIGTIFFWMACGSNAAENKEETVNTASSDTSSTTGTAVKNIVFFGNSLTAGYGLDPSEAFPALIQKKIDSLKIPYRVVNAGLSGETSAGGNARVEWILRQPVDIFILELGANDGLRGIDLKETEKNLQSIIDKVKNKYAEAEIILAGMQVPPNMGRAYAETFRGMYIRLAEKNNAALIPFLLEGVGGIPDLNQGDGIHPTAEGHQILASNVWAILEPALD